MIDLLPHVIGKVNVPGTVVVQERLQNSIVISALPDDLILRCSSHFTLLVFAAVIAYVFVHLVCTHMYLKAQGRVVRFPERNHLSLSIVTQRVQ